MPKNELLRLEEIKEEIKDLVTEAKYIVKNLANPNTRIFTRATSYWYPQILIVLDNDHDYMGGSMCTMEETIQELKKQ